MKVSKYLEGLPENQVVVVYNHKHNIEYVGKAGYAPISIDWVCDEVHSVTVNNKELIINEEATI